MLRQRGRACRKWFTMIELMIVVIIVAILAASAVPIYRSAVSRAYDAEVVSALGIIRSAQRAHYAQNGAYVADIAADGFEASALDVAATDFVDMAYVSYGEFSVVATAARWDGDIPGYDYNRVTMAMDGTVTREVVAAGGGGG